MIGHDDLVAVREVERADDGVHRRRRVRAEREVVGIGADERADGRPRLVEEAFELVDEETHGLALHPTAPLVLGREHVLGTRAEGAVVQEGDVRVEDPMTPEVV